MEQLSYKLEVFEGPLELLSSLLSKNKLSIYDISISLLLDQYLEHINAMKENNMDVASEFMVMASRLVYLKSVSLLPKHNDEADSLKDELAGELLEYELCRQMAHELSLRTEGFNSFVKKQDEIKFASGSYELKHDKNLLLDSYFAAVGRGQRKKPPSTEVFTNIVAKKIVSVSSKIVSVMRKLWGGKREKLKDVFLESKSRSELVATFLAVLELCKANRVKINGEGEDMTVTLIKEKTENE